MRHEATPPADPEQLLSPARAAAIAERSVKTIRRAYASGRLAAFRDAGGRGVRIRYGDLRGWMMSEPVSPMGEPVPPAPQPTPGGRLALIRAARRLS